MHKDAGTTRGGTPYEMKYTDDYGNVHVRLIDRPDVISSFYRDSNLVDMHNQVRQSQLALEKRWVTTCGYFRLATTLIGINVTDTWKLAMYHKIMKQTDDISIVKFAGILSHQLLALCKDSNADEESSGVRIVSIADRTINSPSSQITSSISSQEVLRVLVDANGDDHAQLRYNDATSRKGLKYCKTRRCKFCGDDDGSKGKLTSYYCGPCNKPYCCPTGRIDRDCFRIHVTEIPRQTRSRRGVVVAGARINSR